MCAAVQRWSRAGAERQRGSEPRRVQASCKRWVRASCPNWSRSGASSWWAEPERIVIAESEPEEDRRLQSELQLDVQRWSFLYFFTVHLSFVYPASADLILIGGLRYRTTFIFAFEVKQPVVLGYNAPEKIRPATVNWLSPAIVFYWGPHILIVSWLNCMWTVKKVFTFCIHFKYIFHFFIFH